MSILFATMLVVSVLCISICLSIVRRYKSRAELVLQECIIVDKKTKELGEMLKAIGLQGTEIADKISSITSCIEDLQQELDSSNLRGLKGHLHS